MDFWDRMKDQLNKGIGNSQDMFGKAKEKAKDLSEKGILKFEVMQLENQAEKLMGKLGTLVYEELVKEGNAMVTKDTSGIRELIDQIDDLRLQIDKRRAKLKNM